MNCIVNSINYRFIGYSTDGHLIFEDRDYPSDAPQFWNLDDETLRRCASTDNFIDGGRYFAVSKRHAEVRGLLGLVVAAPAHRR